MQNAKIFLVEDNKPFADSICELLPFYGSNVVLRASTLEEALGFIKCDEPQKNGVNLAIIDGNFPEAKGKFEVFGGPVVAKAIRDSKFSIKIIAHTAVENATYGDVYVDKIKGPDALIQAIASL